MYYYYYINIIVNALGGETSLSITTVYPYARTLLLTVPQLRRRQSWPSRRIKNFKKKLVAPSPPPLSVYECRYYLQAGRHSPTTVDDTEKPASCVVL